MLKLPVLDINIIQVHLLVAPTRLFKFHLPWLESLLHIPQTNKALDLS